MELARSHSGTTVVEIRQIDPAGPTRWEKRQEMRPYLVMVGPTTDDRELAAIWVDALSPPSPKRGKA